MTPIDPENNTNVRISMLLALLGLSSACATTVPQVSASRQCAATQVLMCEAFGPERKCACGDAAAMTPSLTALGQPGWFGPAVW